VAPAASVWRVHVAHQRRRGAASAPRVSDLLGGTHRRGADPDGCECVHRAPAGAFTTALAASAAPRAWPPRMPTRGVHGVGAGHRGWVTHGGVRHTRAQMKDAGGCLYYLSAGSAVGFRPLHCATLGVRDAQWYPHGCLRNRAERASTVGRLHEPLWR